MRTLYLIQSLSETEIKEVSELLNHGKRKNLKLLFNELKKFRNSDKQPDRGKLFKKIFGKSYSSENEHLLRNKLSRLNETLYNYLAVATFKTSIETDQPTFNLWLAKTYSNRKIKALFDSDIDGFIRDANERVRLDEASQLFAIRATWWSTFGDKRGEGGIEIVDEWRREERRRFSHRMLKSDYLMAYVQVSEPSYKIEKGKNNFVVNGKTISVNVEDPEENDWYVFYLKLLKLQLVGNEEEKRKASEDLLMVTKTIVAQRALGITPYIYCLGNSGYHALITGQFVEAEAYLNEAWTLSNKHGQQVSSVFVLNYMSLLLVLKKYGEVIKLYKESELPNEEGFRHVTRRINYSLALVFLGKVDEAVQSLPLGTDMAEHESVYCRLIYIISFIIRTDFQLAINEANNLKKIILKFNVAEFRVDAIEVNKFLKKYATSMLANGAKFKRMQSAIKRSATFKLLVNQPISPFGLIARWLLEKIED